MCIYFRRVKDQKILTKKQCSACNQVLLAYDAFLTEQSSEYNNETKE